MNTRSDHPHYELLELCGQGGMGVVYRARDRRLNRIVALKFLLADPELASSSGALQRFRREAEAIAALNHPGVATIYEAGEWDGSPFLALEFLGGGSLRQRTKSALLSVPTIVDYATQLGSGLAFAHSKGILHRDIKPGNCMFSEHGTIKLVDFGLAKQAGAEDITQTGNPVGTVPYMSPELLRGEPASVRSDLYALGAVVYEMAAGRPLYGGSAPGALAGQVLNGSAIPLEQRRPGLPDVFCAAVNRAVSHRAEDRFGSVQEFLDHLHHPALVAADLTPTATLAVPAASRSPLRRWWKYAAGAALVAAAVILGLRHWRSTPADAAPLETMVVLPFENLGGDPANQALTDGLQETVTSLLSSADQLRDKYMIVPSFEVRRSQIRTISQARTQFNATLALTGSAQTTLKDLKLTLDLADARLLQQKDSRMVTVPIGETARLESQLAESLGAMLGAGQLPRRGSGQGETSNSAAYALFLQGRGALEERNLDDAIQFLKKALDKDPEFALARAKLAEAYLRKNLFTKDPKWLAWADTEVARAAAGAGQSPEVLMSQALIRRGMGKWPEAIALFQQLLRRDPANVEAYRFLAETWVSYGHLKEAEDTYRQALHLRPGYWPLYESLGDFYSTHNQLNLAEQVLSTGIGLAAETPSLYFNLGATYFRMGRWADAGKAFEKSIALKPTPFGYSNLGTVRFYEGNYAEAAKQCEAAIRLQPANPINWGNLGDALWQLPGEKVRARAAFEKASSLASQQLAVNPDNPRLRKNYALYLAKLGQPQQAVEEARRAIEQAPTDGGVEFYAARVYAVSGNPQAAFEALKKSLALGYNAREIGMEPDFGVLKKDPRYREVSGGGKSAQR